MPKRGEEIRDSSISSGRPTLALNPTGSVARVRCFDLGVDAEETLWKDRDMRHLVVDEGVFRMSDDEDGGSIDRLARGTRPIGSGSGKRRSIGLEVLGKSSRRPTSVIERLTPFRCRRDGTIEELPDLVPGLARSCALCEQDWGNVHPTRSTLEDVSLLIEKSRASGVTFMIPKSDQRPWNPPIGYCCVYESFFGEESKLWFPIPRLITS